MAKRIPTFYTPKQSAPPEGFSPSPSKPALVARALPASFLVAPKPATFAEMAEAHEPTYLKRVLTAKEVNGHGTRSKALAATLPWTCGAMIDACRHARPDRPTAALVSGFHHAGYAFNGGFCTLNGLMVAALAMLSEGRKRVAIIDADAHYGNGTDDILKGEPRRHQIMHYTFGKDFHRSSEGFTYLQKMASLEDDLIDFQPDLIIYQAGADPHIADPLGGILTTDQMAARDILMFSIAQRLRVPLAWNLAGGYQKPMQKVIDLHLQTYRMAQEVYG